MTVRRVVLDDPVNNEDRIRDALADLANESKRMPPPMIVTAMDGVLKAEILFPADMPEETVTFWLVALGKAARSN